MWYHPSDHALHALFRRDAFPPVGSEEWASRYPKNGLPLPLPDQWSAALRNVTFPIKLVPNLAVTTLSESGKPKYPEGKTGSSPDILSFKDDCTVSSDICNAPDGMIGLSFDDGPLPPSRELNEYLIMQGQTATHFYIGCNIVADPVTFMQAYENGDDIAVHTYTHPHLTTLSNAQVVAELGWTMQIIYDSTNGKIPRFWRPPFGDLDLRIRFIAERIFGLTAVLWGHDSGDWRFPGENLADTMASVNQSIRSFISGPKSPGLLILEHELTPQSVQAFMYAYPLMKSHGWDIRAISALEELEENTDPWDF